MAKPAAKKPAAKKSAAKKPIAKQAAVPRAVMSASGVAKASELLGQILAHPEDRAVRLIYADLLAKLGDPRGAFIVQQCGLAELDALDERYPAALASIQRAELAHGRSWIADYADRTKLGPDDAPRTGIDLNLNAVFADGMLQQVAMRQEDIAAEWPKLRAREPIEGIELLVGEGIWPEQKAVAAARELSRLRVSAQDWFTAHSVAAILAWGMPKLRVLELENCDLGTLGAQLLANEDTTLGDHDPEYRKPPPFAKDQLEELALSGGSIGDEGAALIFAAPHLAKLRALDLKGCKLTARSLERLREAPAMRGLRRLGLANNADAGAQLGALAGWSVLANLERLAVPQATTAAGLGALFPAPSPTLRELALVSAKELAQWPGLAGIAEAFIELDLGTTSLGDTRWAGLLAAPSARSLVHLHANGCSLSDAAIDTLAASPLERLVTLDLSSNKLSDAGLETLAAWPGLQHVMRLSLYNNRKLTAAGISALAAAPQFQPARLVISKAAASNELAARFGDALVLR